MRCAFLGLGVMGRPMAAHLLRGGHDVTVYNRTRQRADAWVAEHGGRAAATPAEAAAEAELVCVCVGADADVREVLTLPGMGVLAGLAPGAVVVDHTTISAGTTRELAEQVAGAGGTLLDAPVSGGQAGAEDGRLTVMVGGDPDALERVRPTLACYGATIRHLGPSGAGQLAKAVNQICIAGVLQGLAEGLHFCERAGLDPEAVLEVIGQGAARSWQMENRWRTMARGAFDFGFAVRWMRKDLAIALAEARGNRSTLPLTALVDQFYGDVEALGGAGQDTSSLVRRLRERS